MRQPPELWSTLSFNLLILLVGGVLATISSLAYRREGDRSFLVATLGFVATTGGVLTIATYQTMVKRSYVLGGVELLRLQTIQGILILLGFSTLLYSLYRY